MSRRHCTVDNGNESVKGNIMEKVVIQVVRHFNVDINAKRVMSEAGKRFILFLPTDTSSELFGSIFCTKHIYMRWHCAKAFIEHCGEKRLIL